jgi:hypothetical protein
MQKNRWSRIFTLAGLLLILGGSLFTPDGAQGASSRGKRGKPQTQRTERAKTANEDLMSAMGRFAVRQAENLGRGTVTPKKGGAPSLTLEDLGEDEATSNPAGGQAETSIAVDSTGMHVVIGYNDTRGFSLNPLSVSGIAYSDDGGVTFTDGGQLPITTGTSNIGTTILPQVVGDPEVKYLGSCDFIYFSIMVKKFSATTAAQTMCVHRSTDCGHTWTGPFEVTAATNPHGAVTAGGSPRDSADKEFADVDPETGRVLMSWSNFTPFAPGGVEISTTFSDDILSATPPTWSPRSILGATANDGQASIPRFAGNGSGDIYVAWRRIFAGNLGNTGFARSIDNGASWGPAVNLAPVNFYLMDQVLGNDRINTSPSLAVDLSSGAYAGNIYVVYANNSNHDGADIVFQRSTDGGASFSAPVRLDSRPGSDRAQWFPWVTVDKDTGRVYAHYLDQGIAGSGDLSEATYLFSDDGGMTWSRPMPLTDRPFKAGWGNDTGQPNLGDYNQATAQGGELFAVWGGTELKGFADQQPSGSFSTPDYFFKRAPAAKVSVDLGAVSFVDGNGNGSIDPGEQVNLKLPLRNYVTNPVSAGGVTGITGTLSTTTAGVSVTQASSGYPNLGAGSSALNSTDYVLQIAPAFIRGTHIDLALGVSANEGTTTLLYSQSTGTPSTTVLQSQNFNGVAPGALPAGWAAVHGAGSSTVPWTTNNSFKGTTSNAAFHVNANDGVPGPGTTGTNRWERLVGPVFAVPANAEYVTVDMDLAYDTEDDPNFNIQAFDGLFLRITDQTGLPRQAFSALAEAFVEEMTTGTLQHYNKHLPRSTANGYFPNGDMSCWAGDSQGFQHVRLKFPGAGGLAGGIAQLRFEFTQDGSAICSDVRPGHTCGVMVDNIVVRSVVSVQPTSLALDPAAGQYSDVVTLKATVSPATSGTDTAAGTVEFFVDGGSVGSAPLGASGEATLSYTIPKAAGSYPISANFTSSSPAFLNSSASSTLTVTKEDAAVIPSALNPVTVKVGSPGGTGSFTLSAAISEFPDGSLGDISLATPVTFTLSPVAPGSTLTCTPSCVGGGIGGTKQCTCSFSGVAVNVYDVQMVIGGNYYLGSAGSILTVYDPTLGFTTGGGTIMHDGIPASFGFSVKYLKNGQTQGSLLYIEHRSSGDVKLKSNAMQSLAIVSNIGVILGKATLGAVGNYGFMATVLDAGEPGTADQFGLQVTAPDEQIVPDLTFSMETLTGGNIQVPKLSGQAQPQPKQRTPTIH